ncbi:ferredoxin reductase-like protein [Phlegmacium glaucopus]|nr:ferredoxin reductase-like protein [Phlegmacium glaucopus]
MTYYSRCLPQRHWSARPTPLITVLGALGAGAALYLFLPDPSRGAPTLDHVPLSSQHFTKTRVISNEESGPHTKLLKIAIAPDLLPPRDLFDPIWSVYIKDDDIQVERPYTPLQSVDENGHMLFWIKKYPKGEVGRWLHSKLAGDEIELRGPINTWKWERDSWDEVVMISGGTGITPFVQLFHNVISKPTKSPNTRFTLIHSSRVPGELPPPIVLEPLTAFAAENSEKFKIHVFVDAQDGSNSPLPILHINTGRITGFALERCLRSEQVPGSWWRKLFHKNTSEDKRPRRTLFLVCGPEPMIGAIAGPYGRNFSQGAIGGILGRMGIASENVYKL